MGNLQPGIGRSFTGEDRCGSPSKSIEGRTGKVKKSIIIPGIFIYESQD
jgi:hypothetical protein